MDWKLFAQLVVTVLVALAGGWLGHSLSARRDLLNERRKLRVTYLIEAYRRLEDAVHRNDPARSWPKWESSIADIQLLGSPAQVALARRFALDIARDSSASFDALINDLRRTLREEMQLTAVGELAVYLRFLEGGPQVFDQTLATTRHDVEEAKAEGASIAPPDARQQLEDRTRLTQPTLAIIDSWSALETLVRRRLEFAGIDTTTLGSANALNLALERGVITDVQHRSLRGLNMMRNLAVHGGREVDSARSGEFVDLTSAMRTVLEATEPGAGS